ncbi:MAG: hypothetical protein ACOCQD_02090 [archaeon]
MELKEFNKYVQDWDKDGKEKLEEVAPGTQTQPRVLNRNVANKYKRQPGRTIITRQNRQDLYKETDLNNILPAIDSAFEMIVTAAYGTSLERWIIGRLNQLRNQLKKKAEQEMKKQK